VSAVTLAALTAATIGVLAALRWDLRWRLPRSIVLRQAEHITRTAAQENQR
jgi:hypothetical protein